MYEPAVAGAIIVVAPAAAVVSVVLAENMLTPVNANHPVYPVGIAVMVMLAPVVTVVSLKKIASGVVTAEGTATLMLIDDAVVESDVLVT